jgi:FkbH-like protein
MYQQERQREQLQQEVGSLDDWLASLEMKLCAEPLSSANLTRAAQLLNKTNQLNLRTRRLTEPELLEWCRGAKRSFWTISVSDRFGDAGLTGLLSLEIQDGRARVIDFVLSCRVMGRRVEETMVHMAVTAASESASTLEAELLPTAKNKPCLSFWQKSGFEQQGETSFTWDLGKPYGLPPTIALDWTR